MNDLFQGFEFICAYIDEILILPKGYCTYHLHDLELTQNKLKGKGIKCNIEKSLFGQTKIECLVLWVTRNGVKYMNQKMESITNMKPPTSPKEVPV